jgi:hypothetical protein
LTTNIEKYPESYKPRGLYYFCITNYIPNLELLSVATTASLIEWRS